MRARLTNGNRRARIATAIGFVRSCPVVRSRRWRVGLDRTSRACRGHRPRGAHADRLRRHGPGREGALGHVRGLRRQIVVPGQAAPRPGREDGHLGQEHRQADRARPGRDGRLLRGEVRATRPGRPVARGVDHRQEPGRRRHRLRQHLGARAAEARSDPPLRVAGDGGQAGTHTVKWRVAAGLNGKAQARAGGDRVPQGQFTVDVSDTPAQSRIDPATGEIVRSN